MSIVKFLFWIGHCVFELLSLVWCIVDVMFCAAAVFLVTPIDFIASKIRKDRHKHALKLSVMYTCIRIETIPYKIIGTEDPVLSHEIRGSEKYTPNGKPMTFKDFCSLIERDILER